MRIDQGITFFLKKLIKLVLKQGSSHKCGNSQFSYLIFTIQFFIFYSFFIFKTQLKTNWFFYFKLVLKNMKLLHKFFFNYFFKFS
jgi:hypothetical protein